MKFEELLKSQTVILDGAMGTQLQRRGLKSGEIPELWNLTRPDDIRAVHRDYFDAGANVVYSNTFGASPAKYHGEAPLADVIAAAVALAREAARGDGLVAFDAGPTGRLLKPAGDFEFDAAYDSFAEAITLGAKAGADLVAIETINDTYELKAAILAAKENCDLPIIATVALSEDGKLLTGADVDCLAALFNALKPAACGFNCGLGPDRLLPFVKRLAALTDIPVVVKANAGMPRIVEGRTVFDVTPDAFAKDIALCIEAGAAVVGGCCGTTPAHIAAAARIAAETPREGGAAKVPRTVISSYSKCVELPMDDSLVIGERINPTGKKKLKEAYKSGDVSYILREAIAQTDAGAHILDVNAGVPGIDEARVLRSTVEAIQSVTDAPLQIDTSSPEALEAALRHYNGKALINSVNGKDEVMDAVFPIVAKYGGVLVALTLDENGIPATVEGRVAIAKRIVERGAKYGLKPEDFVIDVLCLAVSADPSGANVILESLRRVHDELGLRTVLGVSNISFGLPARTLLNSTFYTLALGAGLTTAIVNPLSAEMMAAYRAWRALTGRDRNCGEWVSTMENGEWKMVSGGSGGSGGGASGGGGGGGAPNAAAAGSSARSPNAPSSSIGGAITHGLRDDAATLAAAALAAGKTPVEVIDGEIVPALEVVGKGFESGKVFLPQLLMAAEAASAAFEIIRARLAESGAAVSPRGPIVIATVKGDIHDIGKNIVRALLENYGFKVIDLGRDVAPEAIVEAARRSGCKLVGLSALMTTTVCYMEETIKLLRAADPEIKTFVGGAVLTADYAEQIGATWYAKDAMASVRIAESFFK